MGTFAAYISSIESEIGGQLLLKRKPPLGYVRVAAISLFRVW